MMNQKDAVLAKVQELVPTFVPFKDVALTVLSKAQVEYVKNATALRIMSGDIEYTKDRTNSAEVTKYARSMVLNHFKKTKEFNGNVKYVPSANPKQPKVPKIVDPVIDMSLLPDDLKTYVESLV